MFRTRLFTVTNSLLNKPVILTVLSRQGSWKKIFLEMEKKRINQETMDGIVSNKVGSDKLTPASINFIVAGNGGIGVPKSLYVLTSEDAYLIGCSESTHRLAIALR